MLQSRYSRRIRDLVNATFIINFKSTRAPRSGAELLDNYYISSMDSCPLGSS